MTTEVDKTEAKKQEIRDLCMEIIGLSYESKPDPVKILNRSMALANANADLAREWAAKIAEQTKYCDGMERNCGTGAEIAKRIRESQDCKETK